MLLNRSGKALALFTLTLAAGCSSLHSASDQVKDMLLAPANSPIKITSEPSGAEVYVMGKNIGATPLQIEQKDVFPLTYPREKEALYGTVTLKKAGCADLTRTVSTKILDAGLKAQLDCAVAKPAPLMATEIRNVAPAPAAEVKPAAPPPAAELQPAADAVEQRLEKIRSLLNKGLISEDEAKKARERVLNDL